MADRDELIAAIRSVLWRRGQSYRPKQIEAVVDAALAADDLGGGRRIAIIEQTVVREAVSISHADDGWHGETRPLFRIVTPDDPYEPTDEDELLENGFDIDAALGAVTPTPEDA